MKIGLTYDLRTENALQPGEPPDANAEFDHPDTVEVIAEAVRVLGHEPVRIGNVHQLIRQWDRLDVDFVFNIAEGKSGRNREAQVPILLELKKIPYAGSDALTQALTLDKLITKKVLVSEGIPTPRYFQIEEPSAALPTHLEFPLIVKPRFEGSSKGLSEKSKVSSVEELKRQAAWLIETYQQPALIEQFIRGNEYTVAIIGNKTPEVFPPVQIQIDGKKNLGDLFYTFTRIREGAQYLCPAEIPSSLDRQLRDLALRTYRAVDCVDFGRVDFRVDESGKPYVLEINPLPSISTEDVFAVLAKYLDIPFSAMLGKIITTAMERNGLTKTSTQGVPA